MSLILSAMSGVGVSMCHIISVDAIDCTPVIDIKPVMSGFQPRGEFREPDWAHEIMRYY